MARLKVLFISRRFPPSRGGMERYAADLSTALADEVTVEKVVWTRQNKWLSVAALPLLFVQAAIKLATDSSITIIHSQDALTAPMVWLLSKLFNTPYVTVVHGLDVTYRNPLYRAIVLPFVRRARSVIANSHATAQAAVMAGVRDVQVVFPGVDAGSSLLGNKPSLVSVGLDDLADKTIILTVGRLVRRKGVAWFTGAVLPKLVKKDPTIHYVVVGEGREREAIQLAIERHGLSRHVALLGSVSEDVKLAVFADAKLFVMPNIVVEHDMEGFGIVAQEAALAELPLVASRLEGIADAVVDGKNGTLVAYEDSEAYVRAITDILALSETDRRKRGHRARAFTLEHFSWGRTATAFVAVYQTVIERYGHTSRRHLKPMIGGMIVAATLAFATWYLVSHPALITTLTHTSVVTIAWVFVGYTGTVLGLGIILYATTLLYGKRLGVGETFLLNAYSSITNFFGPGQSGSGIRAVYLKVKHGLKLRSFVFASLIYYAVYVVLSVLMLLVGGGHIVLALLAAGLAALVSWVVIALYRRRSKPGEGITNPVMIAGIVAGTIVQLTALAAIYYAEIQSVHPGVSLAQTVSYTGGANLSLFIALTPGAIGIREALLAATQSLHHVSTDTIIAAGVIDRALYVVYLGLLAIIVAAMHGQKRFAAAIKH